MSINDQKTEIMERAERLVAHFPDDHHVYERLLHVGDQVVIEWQRIDARSWAIDVYLGNHRVILYWHPSRNEVCSDNEECIQKTLEILRQAMVLEDLASV